MGSTLLSIGLDVLVLIFLGVTIYYALKLSKSLNNFRAYKEEFNELVAELSRNIEEAHIVIERMKNSGSKSGSNLEAMLRESKLLADELQLINQAGNSLATRLEGLAEKNRLIAQGLEDDDEYDEQLYRHVEHMESSLTDSKKDKLSKPFVIHDQDFEGSNDEDGSDIKSQAEKELFQALKKNKRRASH